MKKDSPLHTLLQRWAQDAPLLPEEGASSAAVDEARFLAFTTHFQAGANLKGIVTLARIARTLSMPAFRFPEKQIFRLACRLFTDAPAELVESVAMCTITVEEVWRRASPVFPPTWPEKYDLPMYCADATQFPSTFSLLANEEVYMAFCMMLSICIKRGGVSLAGGDAKSRAGGASPAGGEKTSQPQDVSPEGGDGKPQPKVPGRVSPDPAAARQNKFAAAVDAARKLARNISITVRYIPQPEDVERVALELRDANEDLQEFMGITGFNRTSPAFSSEDVLQLPPLICNVF